MNNNLIFVIKLVINHMNIMNQNDKELKAKCLTDGTTDRTTSTSALNASKSDDNSALNRSVEDMTTSLATLSCDEDYGHYEDDDQWSTCVAWGDSNSEELEDKEEMDSRYRDYKQRMKSMFMIEKNGLYKRLVERGAGAHITEQMAIVYDMKAYIEREAEPVDSTRMSGRSNLQCLAYDRVVPGVRQALLTMQLGEKSEFIVWPHLAIGCSPRIPEGAIVLYVIHVNPKQGSLFEWQAMPLKDRSQVPLGTLITLCDVNRINGELCITIRQFNEALDAYRPAIDCLERLTVADEEETQRINDLLLKLYQNMAQTYRLLQTPSFGIEFCDKALAIDANDVKALQLKGLAQMSNNNYTTARSLLERAQQLMPMDRGIKSSLRQLDRMSGETQVEREIARKGRANK